MIGILLIAAAAGVSVQGVDESRARQFLDGFVAQPESSKVWFAKDATIVFGDIGGHVSESIRVLRSKEAAWMRTCKVANLSREASPTAEQMIGEPPEYKRGTIAIFSGQYVCTRADNPGWQFSFRVGFVGDQVAMLMLGEGPKHG